MITLEELNKLVEDCHNQARASIVLALKEQDPLASARLLRLAAAHLEGIPYA